MRTTTRTMTRHSEQVKDIANQLYRFCLPVTEIARIVKAPIPTVYTWIKKKRRPGRPKKR